MFKRKRSSESGVSRKRTSKSLRYQDNDDSSGSDVDDSEKALQDDGNGILNSNAKSKSGFLGGFSNQKAKISTSRDSGEMTNREENISNEKAQEKEKQRFLLAQLMGNEPMSKDFDVENNVENKLAGEGHVKEEDKLGNQNSSGVDLEATVAKSGGKIKGESKYIKHMKEASKMRQFQVARWKEKKQLERNEGNTEDYADKPSYVTSAYKEYLRDKEEWENREKLEADEEEKNAHEMLNVGAFKADFLNPERALSTPHRLVEKKKTNLGVHQEEQEQEGVPREANDKELYKERSKITKKQDHATFESGKEEDNATGDILRVQSGNQNQAKIEPEEIQKQNAEEAAAKEQEKRLVRQERLKAARERYFLRNNEEEGK